MAVLTQIEKDGALDVARRVLSICSQVFPCAMPLGNKGRLFELGDMNRKLAHGLTLEIPYLEEITWLIKKQEPLPLFEYDLKRADEG